MSPRPQQRPLRPAPTPLTAEEVAFVRGLVLEQDEHILALNKPAGLSSQGGRRGVNTLDELLAAFAKPSGVKPRLIHRLDRDTSGVILTARSQPAAAALGKAMMARRFSKTYLALVGSGPELPPAGEIDQPLRREEVGREAYMRPCPPEHPDAEAALTRFEMLAGDGRAALLRLRPETGRMHQLRVHLQGLGRPILGDARYGGALTVGGAAVPRLMLHAARLEFPHPTGRRHAISAPAPADLVEAAERLGLAAAL